VTGDPALHFWLKLQILVFAASLLITLISQFTKNPQQIVKEQINSLLALYTHV